MVIDGGGTIVVVISKDVGIMAFDGVIDAFALSGRWANTGCWVIVQTSTMSVVSSGRRGRRFILDARLCLRWGVGGFYTHTRTHTV